VGNLLAPYLFIAPFLLSFIVFFVFPAGYSLVLSFFSYKGYGEARFTGLDNYKSLLAYSGFWQAVRNTIFYFAAHVVPVMVISFLLAILLHSALIGRSKTLVKPLLFLPQISPVVAAALIWRIMFGTQSGVVNKLLGTEIPFLTQYSLTRWIIVLLIVWRGIGWYMVIFMSGLTTISDEITDAAKIDGANPLQNVLHIVVPLMQPIFMFAFITDAIDTFKIFTEPNILGPRGVPLPFDLAPMMNMLIMNVNGGSFGMAAASGWMLFAMVLAVAALQWWFFSRREASRR
jgi:ABC-type sugar transport system permease subunit